MSEARAPRARVLADGSALAGVMAVDVFANNHLAADRFRVRLAARVADMAGLQAPGVRLDVQVGFDDRWASLVLGTADAISFDPIRGVLEIEGRDLSSGMIEARVGETFANRTSSEIVEVIAGRHGLAADATPTSTLAGRYYQNEHERLTLGQFARAMSEWDLLAFLAGQEGFDLFMEGERLRFAPPAEDRVVVLRVEDCLSLELEHELGLSRAIEVTVRSWGTRDAAMVEHTARRGSGRSRSRRSRSGRSGSVGTTWRHGLVRPNLDSEQARVAAERALADLLRHEWTAQATMPGELDMTARTRVALLGAGLDWDRDYAVAELSRHLDVRRGFTQRLCLQAAPLGPDGVY